MPPELTLNNKLVLTIGFALASGWADLISFLRYESFAALMTGNAIKLGIAASSKDAMNVADTIFFACILISYTVGCWIYSEMKRVLPKQTSRIAAPLCFVLVLAADVLYQIVGENRWQVLLLAAAFGVQNTFSFGGVLMVNTTIITGSIQKIAASFSKVVHGENAHPKEWACPLATVVATIAAAVAAGFVLVDGTDMDLSWLFLPAGVLQSGSMLLHDYWLNRPAPAPEVVGSVQTAEEVGISTLA